jgi:hypothetical protein
MDPERRRLTLFDLGFIVAASALAMAAMAWLYPDVRWSMMPTVWRYKIGHFGIALGVVSILAEELTLLLPAIVILCTALLGLGLWRPRPLHLRNVWSQPGTLACAVIAIVALLSFGIALLREWARGVPVGPPPWRVVTTEWPISLTGTAIVIVWATLGLMGRWRPERSWMDRAGRAIGLLVVIGALCLGVQVFFG